MRTTITFSDDVAALIQAERTATGAGTSAAVNDLVRRGAIAGPPAGEAPELPAFDVGLRVDVRDIGDVLALLDESGA